MTTDADGACSQRPSTDQSRHVGFIKANKPGGHATMHLPAHRVLVDVGVRGDVRRCYSTSPIDAANMPGPRWRMLRHFGVIFSHEALPNQPICISSSCCGNRAPEPSGFDKWTNHLDDTVRSDKIPRCQFW